MNYIIEAVDNPQFGAVEHQFTQQPQVHIVNATDPDTFRHQLWSCTTNGEYPSVSFEALQNPANVRAVRTWFKIVSDTRHWEFEPYFAVDGARAVGLEEIGYIAYAQNAGIVEITVRQAQVHAGLDQSRLRARKLSRRTGAVTYSAGRRRTIRTIGFSISNERATRNRCCGRCDSNRLMRPYKKLKRTVQRLRSTSFNREATTSKPQRSPFEVKITRANRASRTMQYVWWGEVVAKGSSSRLLAVGAHGNRAFRKSGRLARIKL